MEKKNSLETLHSKNIYVQKFFLCSSKLFGVRNRFLICQHNAFVRMKPQADLE